MREVMRLIGKSLAPSVVMREMLHLMSELLGLNRGRIVLADPGDPGDLSDSTARICYAYGLTQAEMERGVYRKGEGITVQGQASRYIEPIARQVKTIVADICGGEPVPYEVRPAVVRVKTTSLPLTLH